MFNNKVIPRDGIKGLKENFIPDLNSGFIVFLLALPLSLGIAKASDFPPLMGLITAIIGGVIGGLLSGSPLTIKGPAAGLIVIVVGAVADFGGGEIGWHMACGAIVIAGMVQVLFGVFKFGKFTDIFPLSAVHGMLAAIGMIIILKQFPILLGVDPKLMKGMSPLEIAAHFPNFAAHFNPIFTALGVVSLAIMLIWPTLKQPILKKIPASLVVLLIAIPTSLFMDFKATQPPYELVKIGNFIDSIKINADIYGVKQWAVFVKYVIMMALVGSLEALLTVKAVDMMDPFKRKSNTNKDLIAIGFGNMIAGLLGGLPMISEVARSSANVNNGGKTRWANVFHGLFILLFVIKAVDLIELIPNAALAAMLISVGIKLAHPKEFVHMFQIGKEQLAIFLVTIFFTLYEDLLVGIFMGMALKIIIHVVNGVSIKEFFSSSIETSFHDGHYILKIEKSAVFTNFLKLKEQMEGIPVQQRLTIDLTDVKLIDHNVMSNIDLFGQEYISSGGTFEIIGLENKKGLSNHPLSTRKLK